MTQKSQYAHAGEIVDKIYKVLGHFPGHRALHADGRLFRGSFRAYAAARDYTRAEHLQGDEIPVTVRFSKGGGDPTAHFSATVGMATRFYLPDGRVTNLVMLSQKLFIANSIDQFLELVDAAQPIEPGGPPNLDGLKMALAANPNSFAVFQMRAASPGPVSFAHTTFHAVHAFRFLNAANAETHVRCHWIPMDGERGRPLEELVALDVEILFQEFRERIVSRPARFELVLELAEPGDPLNDATALWPEGRTMVPIGELVVSEPTTEAEIGDALMNHDPTMLVDGIEATDDPILQIRRGVYEVSAARRSGGWHGSAIDTEANG
jgi:catalase